MDFKGGYLVVAILCGGLGTRLWPLSRELMPKQFVKLNNSYSLFQETILRNINFSENFFVLTNKIHYFLAYDEINDLNTTKKYNYILEDVSKNTAASLLFLALNLKKDEVIFSTPSDHVIENNDEYKEAIQKAKQIANEGKIALFGIKPKGPDTAYGYIKDSKNGVEFFEKPEIEIAKKYFQSGEFYWNSGMFCFKAGSLIREFELYNKEFLEKCKNVFKKAKIQNELIRIDSMHELESISIDHAIMEKSKNLELIKSNFKWSDVGSFSALRDEYPKDANNNRTNTELIALDSNNNFALGKKLIATIGVDNLIIVDTEDSLLITNQNESQRVKEVVKILQEKNNPICKIHKIVHRPWGSYEVLMEDRNYKIKRIIVKPNKRLSLQKHFHRNEHWIVVSGSAIVKVENREFILNQNESTYIPMGNIHRLENQGKINLIIIEVQVGEYLGEDDIIRLEDDFNRE